MVKSAKEPNKRKNTIKARVENLAIKHHVSGKKTFTTTDFHVLDPTRKAHITRTLLRLKDQEKPFLHQVKQEGQIKRGLYRLNIRNIYVKDLIAQRKELNEQKKAQGDALFQTLRDNIGKKEEMKITRERERKKKIRKTNKKLKREAIAENPELPRDEARLKNRKLQKKVISLALMHAQTARKKTKATLAYMRNLIHRNKVHTIDEALEIALKKHKVKRIIITNWLIKGGLNELNEPIKPPYELGPAYERGKTSTEKQIRNATLAALEIISNPDFNEPLTEALRAAVKEHGGSISSLRERLKGSEIYQEKVKRTNAPIKRREMESYEDYLTHAIELLENKSSRNQFGVKLGIGGSDYLLDALAQKAVEHALKHYEKTGIMKTTFELIDYLKLKYPHNTYKDMDYLRAADRAQDALREEE